MSRPSVEITMLLYLSIARVGEIPCSILFNSPCPPLQCSLFTLIPVSRDRISGNAHGNVDFLDDDGFHKGKIQYHFVFSVKAVSSKA